MTDAGHIIKGDAALSWLDAVDDLALVLNRAQTSAHGTEALSDILVRVLPRLRVEIITVLLYNASDGELALEAAAGIKQGAALPDESYRIGDHITGSAFGRNTALIENALQSNQRANQRMLRIWPTLIPSRTLRNGLFIPFDTEQECSGVLRLFNRLDYEDTPADFIDADVRQAEVVARLLAGIIAVVWERQRFGETTSVLSEIAESDEIDDVANKIVRLAVRITNSHACALYIIEPHDAEHFRLAALCGFKRMPPELKRFPVKGSISGTATRNHRTEHVYDLQNAPGVANRAVLVDEKFYSALVVPLLTTLVSGCIVVFRRDERKYKPSTGEALEHLTLLVGSVLQARAKSMGAAEFKARLAKASHSVRNPLVQVNKVLDAIQQLVDHKGADPTAIKTKLTSAFEELRRANERIDNWLHIPEGAVRAMGLDRRDIALSVLLERVSSRLQGSARKRHVEIKIDDSVSKLPNIRLDREKMDLVFENLIENAIKYSWEHEAVDIRGEFSERQVRVSIVDKGLGIPQGMYEVIFDGLQRSPLLDRTRYIRGTGLGLQIVKNIVEAHGGFVEVSSRPFLDDPERIAAAEGYETRFTIHLPR